MCLVSQSCPTLCNPLDCSPSGSSVHGIFQARKLLLLLLSRFSCVQLCATPWTAAYQATPSMGFSRQEDWSELPFPSPMHESESEVTQSCPTISDPMDCSLPGSSVHGILQARILEWVAMPFARGSSQPRDRTQVSCIAGGFFTGFPIREALGNRSHY